MARFLVDALKKTAFCIALFFLFNLLIKAYVHVPERLNPLTNKIEDFELSDLCFAYLHGNVPPDTNIYIIHSPHDELPAVTAAKISKAERAGAKAIGLDMIFSGTAASEQAKQLMDTINVYKRNVILAVTYTADQSKATTGLPFYKKLIERNNGNGSYNWGYLQEQSQFDTKRDFQPFFKFNDDSVDAFAVNVLRTAFGNDSIAALKERNEERELINYRSTTGVGRYRIFDKIPEDQETLQNKIVLFGDTDPLNLADLHYTPLNKYIGRSLPDMQGIVFHAQVLSMIMAHDYIDEPGKLTTIATLIIVCFLFMCFFTWLSKYHGFYHLFVDIVFLMIAIPLSLLVCKWLLDSFRIKCEPTTYLVPIFFCGLCLHFYDPVTIFFKEKIFKLPFHKHPGKKAPGNLAGNTVKALLFLVSLMPGTLIAQTTHYIIYPCKGKLEYKKLGNWKPVSRAMYMDDSAWIRINSKEGSYYLEKGKYCKAINETGMRQVKTIRLDVCDHTEPPLEFLREMYKDAIKPDSVVPATKKDIAYGDIMFPANTEKLPRQNEVAFQWNINPGVDKDWVILPSDNLGKAGSRGSSNDDPVKTRGDNVPIVEYHKDSSFYWYPKNVSKPNPLRFSFAGEEEMRSLHESLASLESLKSNFDSVNYAIIKADIYARAKMYSEANRVYELSLKNFPLDTAIKIAYRALVDTVRYLNGLRSPVATDTPPK